MKKTSLSSNGMGIFSIGDDPKMNDEELTMRTLLKKLFRGLGVTAVSLIFQACYGTPQDFGLDVYIQGAVKSRTSGQPIKGIRVSVEDALESTDSEGKFRIYVPTKESYTVTFTDMDGEENGGKFAAQTKKVGSDPYFLNIELELENAE